MKIALFSDVHANLPALEAALSDIDSKKVDAVYCLGDLVGYNVWPNEVINLVRRRGIATIAGNYDYGVGRTSDDCGCAYKTDEEKALGKLSIAYTNESLKADERAYLRTLPAHIRLEFQLTGSKLNVLFVHGSPRKVNEYLFEDRDEQSMLRIMEHANCDVLCFGHTHRPYHRIVQRDTNFKHAINIGSVGKPKDGNPQGGYVILSISENSSVHDPVSIKPEFVRFKYDIEKAATAIENSPLPNEFAGMLRTG